MPEPTIIPSTEIGKLQVMHLKRYWNKSILKREGKLKSDSFHDEWKTDTTLLAVLGLGLEQTIQYLYQTAPSFDQFENWVTDVTGQPHPEKIKQFNRMFTGDNDEDGEHGNDLLTKDDWDFWQQNGYIIIRNAVDRECCDQTIEVICNHIGIERDDADTWYNHHPDRKGIMVQLFQHPLLDQNRQAFKIKKAYQELWNKRDLWVNTDRVGFNPPETKTHTFQGAGLHWDVSLQLPVPFGLQGILYLCDTAENQGALTLVPGFQNRIEQWLTGLPGDIDPRKENLHVLGAKPIAANAGDFIIWHHALPHGGSPNTSALPRFVQYINYVPAKLNENAVWK